MESYLFALFYLHVIIISHACVVVVRERIEERNARAKSGESMNPKEPNPSFPAAAVTRADETTNNKRPTIDNNLQFLSLSTGLTIILPPPLPPFEFSQQRLVAASQPAISSAENGKKKI